MEFRCPQCGKRILTESREDRKELVVKVRFLKIAKEKNTVCAKCRHCGRIMKLPFVKAAV